MPYASLKDANPAIRGIKPAVTLAQANVIAKWADSITVEKGSPWAIAIAQFKRIYEVVDGKWVKRSEDEERKAARASVAAAVLDAALALGGPGSGNWGHAGRPGHRGGSQPRGVAVSLRTGKTAVQRRAATKNPDKEVAVIRKKGEKLIVQTPYDADFVSDLKNNIVPSMRRWNDRERVWEVDVAAEKVVHDLTKQYFQPVDGDKFSSKEIKQIKQAAQVARIKRTQKALRERESDIQAEIERLDDVVSRYSYSSRSSRKMAVIKNRALLQYTLRDLRVKPEQMYGVQERGMAAALRYLEGLR